MDYSTSGPEPQNVPQEPIAQQPAFGAQPQSTQPLQPTMPTPMYTPIAPQQPMVAPVQPGTQPASQWQPTMTQSPQNLTPSIPMAQPGVPPTQQATPGALYAPSKSTSVPLFVWIIFIVLVLGAGGLAAAVVFMK